MKSDMAQDRSNPKGVEARQEEPLNMATVSETTIPPVPALPRVSVIIPAMNEARNLPWVLQRMPNVYEVILVDGRSTDDTVIVARDLRPDVRVITQAGRGKGDALIAGFRTARGDVLVTLDADGSADPAEIPYFVDALLTGADFAKGSRFVAGGGSADLTLLRRIGNGGLTFTVNRLFGSRYTDLCYGYNAFWAHCVPYIREGYDGFEIETLVTLNITAAGLAVREVASFELERMHGVSNLRTFRDGFRVLRTIVSERVRVSRGGDVRRRPVLADRPLTALMDARRATQTGVVEDDSAAPMSTAESESVA
jgi:glycosyltransferase involved in cell wall biosynthesis